MSSFVDPERFRDCVHCGLCLSACPTYLELGTEADSPRGRIYLMRELQEGSLSLSADVVRHLDLCLGCRACETACPSGVRYGELIENARAYVEAHHPRPRFDRLRRRAMAWLFPRPQVLRFLLLPLRLLELVGVLAWVRRVVPRAALVPVLRSWPPLPAVVEARGPSTRRVGLLAGCVAQVLFASVNRATVRVLTRHGCAVETPPAQGCCGALYLHAGDREAAQTCARRNIDVFARLDTVVVNAAGCGAVLKEYGALLAGDPQYAERARAFSAKVRDVNELMATLPQETPTRRLERKVTYHDACHLAHAQGVRDAPRQLLRRIPGLELIELPEGDLCCGSAGTYNLTEPAMAQRLGARKAENIRATGADIVAVANPGCAMQIQAALAATGRALHVKHPIELLDEAYEGDDPGTRGR
jgi:glycolate oxidase iron-sulfur subunit